MSQPTPIVSRPRLDDDAAAALAKLRTKFGGLSTNELLLELDEAAGLLLMLKAKFKGMNIREFRHLVSDFLPENADDLARITKAAEQEGVPRAAFMLDAANKHLNRIDGMAGRTQATFDKLRKGVEAYAAAGRPISQGRIALDFAGGNKRAAKAFWEENPEWIESMLKLSEKNRPAQIATKPTGKTEGGQDAPAPENAKNGGWNDENAPSSTAPGDEKTEEAPEPPKKPTVVRVPRVG